MKGSTKKAYYFGLEVEVVWQMNNCCLIRFNDRESVVDTADVVFKIFATQGA